MAELMNGYDKDKDIYTLQGKDPLAVLSSTRTVVELGEQVRINTQHVEQLSKQWIQEDARNAFQSSSLWDNTYHFFDASPRTISTGFLCWMRSISASGLKKTNLAGQFIIRESCSTATGRKQALSNVP